MADVELTMASLARAMSPDHSIRDAAFPLQHEVDTGLLHFFEEAGPRLLQHEGDTGLLHLFEEAGPRLLQHGSPLLHSRVDILVQYEWKSSLSVPATLV